MTKRIIYAQDDGVLAVVIPAPGCGLTIEQLAAKDVPPVIRYEGTGIFDTDEETGESFEVQRKVAEPRQFEIVDTTDVPSDRTFRSAWRHDTTPAARKVVVDVPAAKDIAHARRRAKREEEFKPHDEAIMKQLPGKDGGAAEVARAAIRSRYDVVQINIDACKTPEAIKAVIDAEGL